MTGELRIQIVGSNPILSATLTRDVRSNGLPGFCFIIWLIPSAPVSLWPFDVTLNATKDRVGWSGYDQEL